MIPEKAIGAATESVIASLRAMELGWVDTDMPDGVTIDVRDFDLTAAISEALEAAAPHMLAEAFAYGWREGAGIASPVDLDTGELMHDQAVQPAWNPYKEEA